MSTFCYHSIYKLTLKWPTYFCVFNWTLHVYVGLRDALFLLAKARYLAGDIKAAVSTLQHLIDNLDPTMAEGATKSGPFYTGQTRLVEGKRFLTLLHTRAWSLIPRFGLLFMS
jgi:hypothetical protein